MFSVKNIGHGIPLLGYGSVWSCLQDAITGGKRSNGTVSSGKVSTQIERGPYEGFPRRSVAGRIPLCFDRSTPSFFNDLIDMRRKTSRAKLRVECFGIIQKPFGGVFGG